METAVIRDEAVKLCMAMAEIYSPDLDRKALWERIGNGLQIASAKCGSDWELLLEAMIDYVKGDPGAVASNPHIKQLMQDFEGKPQEWKDEFIRICSKKRMFIIVKAREQWEERKKINAAAKQDAKNEEAINGQ
jgi:hypothetical protein